jgi:integrase
MPPPRKPAKLPKGFCYRTSNRNGVAVRSATIYRRSFAGGGCRYVNTGCTSVDALHLWIAEQRREEERQRLGITDPYKAAKDTPVRTHLDDYLSVVRETSRSPGYPKTIDRELCRLFDGCGVVLLRDLTPFKVQQYLAGLTCAAATKNKARSYLFSFCKWLVQNDRLPANPVEKVKTAKERAADAPAKRQRRAYTVAELRALVAAAGSYPLDAATRPRGGRPRKDGQPIRYKKATNDLSPETAAALAMLGRERQLMYRVWLATGLRRGELSRVTAGMFDARRRTLSLPGTLTKNGRPAVVRLPKRLAAALCEWVADSGRGADAPLLTVPDARSMVRVHQRHLKAAGVAYRTAAGFADVHALRKTANAYLRRKGVPARLRQRFLRHAAADLMTAVYDDERGVEMRPMVKLLGKLDAAVANPSPVT